MREPSLFSLGCQRQPNEFMVSARPPLPLSLPSPMLAKLAQSMMPPYTASPYCSSMFNTASAMTKDSRRFTCPSHLSAVLTLLGKQNACRP